MEMKLDVGCGEKVADGFVGLDIKDFGQKYVLDVRNGLPEGKWEQIRTSHFLEHLSQEEAINFLNDCWDKCQELYIVVPHLKGENAWVLTHKTFYTERTFEFLERDNIDKIYNIRRWEIKKMVTNSRNDIHVWMKPKI